MNFISKYSFIVYIVLWMIYNLQIMLMIRGIITQVVFVLLMVMSFYFFFKVNMYYRTGYYIKWLNMMLVVLSIYGIIPIIGGWTYTGSTDHGSWVSYIFLQNIFISILPIYSFYYFSLTKKILTDNLNYIFIAFLLFSILMYYQNFYSVSLESGKEEITNNAGYFFVPLIPMLQLLKMKDFWKYFFLTIIFGYMLMAMKRGAILAGGVMILLFMIHHFRTASWKKLLYVVSLTGIVLWGVYYFAFNLYVGSDYFQERVKQTMSGDPSGRDAMYSYYFSYFMEKTSALEWFIGNGANATWVLFGNYAHNDWLEFAIDLGVLGLMIYLVYWLVFLWEWKTFTGDLSCKQTLGDLMIAYFLIGLYSMSFNDMPTSASLCIGFCLANKMQAQSHLRCVLRKKMHESSQINLHLI